jgi:hypothetical protein
MLLTRDVGGRRPEGRGPAPPGSNEALDVVGASLPCWDVGARMGTDTDALLTCAVGRWTPPRNIVRPAAEEEEAETLGGGPALRTSALLALLVMRSAAVDTVGAGSAEIDARALRLGNAAGTGGAGAWAGACGRFALGRMNCRTSRVGALGNGICQGLDSEVGRRRRSTLTGNGLTCELEWRLRSDTVLIGGLDARVQHQRAWLNGGLLLV